MQNPAPSAAATAPDNWARIAASLSCPQKKTGQLLVLAAAPSARARCPQRRVIRKHERGSHRLPCDPGDRLTRSVCSGCSTNNRQGWLPCQPRGHRISRGHARCTAAARPAGALPDSGHCGPGHGCHRAASGSPACPRWSPPVSAGHRRWHRPWPWPHTPCLSRPSRRPLGWQVAARATCYPWPGGGHGPGCVCRHRARRAADCRPACPWPDGGHHSTDLPAGGRQPPLVGHAPRRAAPPP